MPATLRTQHHSHRPDLTPGATVTVADHDGPVDVVVTWAQAVREGGRWVHGMAGDRDVTWWQTW